MNDLILTCLLLADRSRILDIAHAFRTNQRHHSPHDAMVVLTIAVALIAGLLLLNRLLDRRDRDQRQANQPLRLFLALCKAHGLSWSDRWLLWRVAHSQKLRDPGRLFLEPERLDPVSLSPSLRPQVARLRMLRERLFGHIAGEDSIPAAQAVAEKPCPAASLDQLASDAFAMPLDQPRVISTWLPQTEVSTADTATQTPG